MDRDNRWNRVEKAYNCLVGGDALTAESATAAVEWYYNNPSSDSEQGDLYLDRGNEYTTVPGSVAAAEFPSGNFTGDLNLEGDLRVKFYYAVADELAVLTEDNMIVPSSVSIHANSWLPASEDGCRSEVGQVPVVEVLPPTVSHKYSATGIAFRDNLVYLCWHSNPETNMDYAQGDFSPSVDHAEDFGGIVDVINIDSYDIKNSLFEQSMENSEFKYNHVIYSDHDPGQPRSKK